MSSRRLVFPQSSQVEMNFTPGTQPARDHDAGAKYCCLCSLLGGQSMRQWGVVGFRGRKVSLPCLILSREQFLYFHNRTFFGLNLLYFFNLPQAFALGGRDILLLEYPLSFSHRDILFQLSLIFFFFFFLPEVRAQNPQAVSSQTYLSQEQTGAVTLWNCTFLELLSAGLTLRVCNAADLVSWHLPAWLFVTCLMVVKTMPLISWLLFSF